MAEEEKKPTITVNEKEYLVEELKLLLEKKLQQLLYFEVFQDEFHRRAF